MFFIARDQQERIKSSFQIPVTRARLRKTIALCINASASKYKGTLSLHHPAHCTADQKAYWMLLQSFCWSGYSSCLSVASLLPSSFAVARYFVSRGVASHMTNHSLRSHTIKKLHRRTKYLGNIFIVSSVVYSCFALVSNTCIELLVSQSTRVITLVCNWIWENPACSPRVQLWRSVISSQKSIFLHIWMNLTLVLHVTTLHLSTTRLNVSIVQDRQLWVCGDYCYGH